MQDIRAWQPLDVANAGGMEGLRKMDGMYGVQQGSHQRMYLDNEVYDGASMPSQYGGGASGYAGQASSSPPLPYGAPAVPNYQYIGDQLEAEGGDDSMDPLATSAPAVGTGLMSPNEESVYIAYNMQRSTPSVMRVTKQKYVLSDFAILRTLGTGSFGRVHLVQSRHNHRFYAIKVLKKQQIIKMKQIEHTNDERAMLAKVKHPFLVTLWGTFADSANLFMVMDFVEGGELFSLLRKTQRFPNTVAKFYAAEVTLSLDFLHANNIIYRDLKPENLLLDRQGHLKITDFGFAKEVPDITWTLCGTPDYLAPEVVASKGYNKSIDWWSLGILTYEMLAGYPPFYADNPMKLYENILECKVRYPPYFDPLARDLLEKLLTPDLSKRYGNLANGSRDIMLHPWFEEVNWERLLRREIEAPYIPPVRAGSGDASLYDRYPEENYAYGQQGPDPYGDLFPEF